jgi:hypothetical protein
MKAIRDFVEQGGLVYCSLSGLEVSTTYIEDEGAELSEDTGWSFNTDLGVAGVKVFDITS